jgi:Fe-S cluster assembly protein SufD
MIIVGLKEAMKTYGTFLTNQWGRSLKEEMDPVAALNGALHSEGAFIYVPPKTVIEAPVQILHLVHTDNEAMLLCPRVHLFLGPQSELHLYSNQGIISEMQGFVNSVVECAIEEEAHLVYTQMAFDEPGEVWHFDAFRANLKRNSTLKTICATAGGPSTRFDYRVALTGENGEAQLNGAWMLNKKNEAHIHVVVDHQAPYCRSMQLYKGVNNEFSHSSFEGKILVRQPAQKTEAFQLNNNLLLSDYAIADSKPNLEIFADDVKASHGATVGQLDNEQLFYMKARGFSLREAQNLLVAGFCKEVTDQIELPSLAKNLNYRMDQYLAG